MLPTHSFEAVFKGGPLNARRMFVHADPYAKDFYFRPARFQEFERPLRNRFGLSCNRTGVFVYQLDEPSVPDPRVWVYSYLRYHEKYS